MHPIKCARTLSTRSGTRSLCQKNESLTDREYTIAARKLGTSLSAAYTSKKVGRLPASPPKLRKLMFLECVYAVKYAMFMIDLLIVCVCACCEDVLFAHRAIVRE
jgi:hypothetical protein